MQRTTRPLQTTGMGLLNKGAARLDFGDATWEPEIRSSVLISTSCSNGDRDHIIQISPFCQLSTEVVFLLCLSRPKSSLLCRGWLFIFHFPSCRTVSVICSPTPAGLGAATASTVSSSLFGEQGSKPARSPGLALQAPLRRPVPGSSFVAGDHTYPHHVTNTLIFSLQSQSWPGKRFPVPGPLFQDPT